MTKAPTSEDADGEEDCKCKNKIAQDPHAVPLLVICPQHLPIDLRSMLTSVRHHTKAALIALL